ncbi:MAG: MAPEG family protein [Chrysiogenetes bacterium]|nr:MAPEG family protein [Chrysiogenetes bacterium]
MNLLGTIHYSALFAAAYLVFLVLLAANVSRLRIQHKVSLGEGGNRDLRHAIRAHANSVEHGAPFMVALLAADFVKVSDPWILWLAVAFGAARVLHAAGMFDVGFNFRRVGAGLTLVVELALAGVIVGGV